MRYLEELYSAVSGMSPREMNERQLRMIDLAVKEVDRLRADVALATDTIQKCKAWIEEAKPLLERGGKAEAELTRLRSENEALKADRERLDSGLNSARNGLREIQDFIWQLPQEGACAAYFVADKLLEGTPQHVNARSEGAKTG